MFPWFRIIALIKNAETYTGCEDPDVKKGNKYKKSSTMI